MKEAKLFTNGKVRRKTAQRIPVSWKIRLYKEVRRLCHPYPKENPWRAMFAACGKFTSDFMAQRDQGDQENREDISL